MSPEVLARLHSEIIDHRLANLKTMFKDLNLSCKSKVGGMCNELELDRKGRVAKTSKNRKIVNNAINFIRKETKGLKPIIFNQYEEATNQINLLSENYINFISNGKKEAGKE